MRQDVKLGVVVSAVLVFVAGGYYLSRDNAELTIPIGASQPRLADSTDEESTGAIAQPAIPPQKRAANRETAPPANRVADRDSGAAKPEAGPDAKTTAPSSTRMALQRIDQSSGDDPVDASGHPPEQTAPAAVSPTLASRADSLLADHPADDSSNDTAGTSGAEGSTDPASPASSPTLARNRTVNDNPTAARRSVPLIGMSRTTPNAAVETHRVQPGDTFSQLAVRYYGSARFTQFLIAANTQAGDPNHLAVGTIINIPPRPAVAEPTTSPVSNQPGASSSSRTHTVRSGDSFYAIARDRLGDASRWRELYEFNKELVSGDPKNLQVGHVVRLPNP